MKICPACQRCYEDVTTVCSEDHTALVTERPGTCLLVGTYRLECLLGRGDKGTAYEATDMELNSPVIAVELNGTKVIDDPQEMKSFHREARRVVRVGGQDVADIYDYGSLPNGGAYVVMERIERDSQREDLLTKSHPSASPITENPVAPPNDHGRPSDETSDVPSVATTAENAEEETLTSPHHTRAASDAMTRLTEEETRTFPDPKTAAHRVVKDDKDDAAAAIHKAITSQEPSLTPPAPSPGMTPIPSANPDRSTQLSSPIVVKVPDGSSGRKRHRHRPLVYVGLAAVVAIAIPAMWLAFNRERATSSNPPVASVTSPTADASTSSLPTTNPPATEPIPPASTEPASPANTIADNPPPMIKTRRRAPNARAQSPRVILGQTLNEWVTATARRNVEWQMSFYMPVLTTFYRRTDVPQDSVREEKVRLFGDAQTVDVRLLGEPQITFSEGGGVATMRFRLSNVAEGGGRNRPGEVRRELRWRKTDEGWKIFSERDL